jgi:hypothetical protein
VAAARDDGSDRYQAQSRRAHPWPGGLLAARIEIDRQASGLQFVTVEDTTGRFHASHGRAEAAGEHILSEPKIVAELAKATLAPNSKVDWDAWSANYALVRDAIAQTYPKIFENFNERIKNASGFDRPIPAPRA